MVLQHGYNNKLLIFICKYSVLLLKLLKFRRKKHLEFIFETILDATLELWTSFIKKRNPDYDNCRSKKALSIVIKVLFILVVTILFLGILFLIEWIFPNILDIVRFD